MLPRGARLQVDNEYFSEGQVDRGPGLRKFGCRRSTDVCIDASKPRRM
jgi:hypothetical protein